ncbi:MAG TPA: DEAD/DEAH box helicase family protein [Armatimonadota bacterium]
MERLNTEIDRLRERLSALDRERIETEGAISRLQHERQELLREEAAVQVFPGAPVTLKSSLAAKHALIRRLFRGRDDVYPMRWESAKTGKAGYQPACRNEWLHGVCLKPRIKCSECPNRDLFPFTDTVIAAHLDGKITIGVYPLLPDETCWFLAADFDKTTWQDDARAFMETCRHFAIPAGLERSRSGNGGHVWIFFADPVPAVLARKLGAYLLTKTMERRPEIGLDSYDRFFPNQDTMPQGGFGNLIALPFQKTPRQQGNSVFVDDALTPYRDPFAFLSSLTPMSRDQVANIVEMGQREGHVLGVRMVVTDEEEETPWVLPPSRKSESQCIPGPLPKRVSIVLGNQLYIEKAGLPPALINRLIRIAAFQNPEFYKAQAMRLPTFGKPRIIACAEDFSKHLGLPRGCYDDVRELFSELGIKVKMSDERMNGTPLDVTFAGTLRDEQQAAIQALLPHELGVLAATTAFGKTVIAARLIAERKVNTLVLVHRQQLLDQWVDRLTTFLNIEHKQIGNIGGGKHKPTGIIDVALIQSLCRKGVVDDLVANYGHLVVDECHHISAVNFEQVARACKARYVTGLSATTVRKDGHQPIIFMQCGPIRYHVDARQQAAARPFDHRVILRDTAFTFPMPDGERPAIQDIYAAMVTDIERNQLLLGDVMQAITAGRSPVILTERTEHLEWLAEQLRPLVQHVIVLKGGMGVKQRRAVMAQLTSIPEHEPRVLVATGRYLGEGFDDARLNTLFLAMPISWKGTLAQYAGRLHRLHDEKTEVVIYDYADFQVPMLARMVSKRLAGYRAIGYDMQEDGQACNLQGTLESS